MFGGHLAGFHKIFCAFFVSFLFPQNPQPNAYTLAIRGKKPFIVLHTSLVDLMEPEVRLMAFDLFCFWGVFLSTLRRRVHGEGGGSILRRRF